MPSGNRARGGWSDPLGQAWGSGWAGWGPRDPPPLAPWHPPYSRPGLCVPAHVPQPFPGPLAGAGGLRRADASRCLVLSAGPLVARHVPCLLRVRGEARLPKAHVTPSVCL